MASKSKNTLEEFLDNYLKNLKVTNSAKSYEEYAGQEIAEINRAHSLALDSLYAKGEKAKPSYGSNAETLGSVLQSGYADRLDEIAKSEYESGVSQLGNERGKRLGKVKESYLGYLEGYTDKQRELKEKVARDLFETETLSPDAAYQYALNAGLSDKDAAEVSAGIYNATREKVISDILASVAAMTLDPESAAMLAVDKGLNYEDVELVKRRAREYYDKYTENSDSYLDYLESIGNKTTGSFK